MSEKIEKHEKKVMNMKRSFVVFAVTILIVVAVGNALMINFQLFFQPVLAEQGAPQNGKTNGDWIIENSDDVYYDTDIELNGNLTIESGGKLTIENLDLIVNCTSTEQFKIAVQAGGEFEIINSNIFPLYTGNSFLFEIHGECFIIESTVLGAGFNDEESSYIGGVQIYSDNVEIKDSEILDCPGGAIYIDDGVSPLIDNNIIQYNDVGITFSNTDASINKCNIYHNGVGIKFYNSPGNVENCNFDENTLDLYIDEDSWPVFVGRSYSPSKVYVESETDTDEDGLWDSEEIYIYFTDEDVLDTDNDEINDGEEVAFWESIEKTPEEAGYNARTQDVDEDKMLDGEEIEYYPSLDPEWDDALYDVDSDGLYNIEELHAFKTDPTSTQTYEWSDAEVKRFLSDVGSDEGLVTLEEPYYYDNIEFAGTTYSDYAQGDPSKVGSEVYITEFKLGTPTENDPFGNGFMTLHAYNDANQEFSITLISYDDDPLFPDGEDSFTICGLWDSDGHYVDDYSIDDTTPGKVIISTDNAEDPGDYMLGWRTDFDDSGSILQATADVPLVYICPWTYGDCEITFQNDGDATDLFFRGHTQGGYITDLRLNGNLLETGNPSHAITVNDNENQLYGNSEFCYYLDSLTGDDIKITFDYIETVLLPSSVWRFNIDTVGWWFPDNHHLDNDGLTDSEEADYGTEADDDDTDDDGMDDYWEVNNDLDPLDPADAEEDPDKDGLSNLVEYQRKRITVNGVNRWQTTDPQKKTLLLEIDYMENHGPSQTVLDEIVESFDAANIDLYYFIDDLIPAVNHITENAAQNTLENRDTFTEYIHVIFGQKADDNAYGTTYFVQPNIGNQGNVPDVDRSGIFIFKAEIEACYDAYPKLQEVDREITKDLMIAKTFIHELGNALGCKDESSENGENAYNCMCALAMLFGYPTTDAIADKWEQCIIGTTGGQNPNNDPSLGATGGGPRFSEASIAQMDLTYKVSDEIGNNPFSRSHDMGTDISDVWGTYFQVTQLGASYYSGSTKYGWTTPAIGFLSGSTNGAGTNDLRYDIVEGRATDTVRFKIGGMGSALCKVIIYWGHATQSRTCTVTVIGTGQNGGTYTLNSGQTRITELNNNEADNGIIIVEFPSTGANTIAPIQAIRIQKNGV